MSKLLIVIHLLLASSLAMSAENRIDRVRFDAPELAYFGDHDVGVRTIELTHADQADVLNVVKGEATPVYDRELTVELWYPATLKPDQARGSQYTTSTRNTSITATLRGRAVRNASVARLAEKAPLLIISHGYPGNRYLMSHLGENLASKGYVVASIDHAGSTYEDHRSPKSTAYHRPLDQVFVIDELFNLSALAGSFLEDRVDAGNTGVVGYSMGGFGLINNLGGGFSDAAVESELAPPNGLLRRHAASNPDYRTSLDDRIKAGLAIAPWGMAVGVWEPEDLKGITVPTFFVSGSADETSGYDDGVRALFLNATASERYLLTFVGAGHNAGAPMPLPVEFPEIPEIQGANHYTDAVWDSLRMNNVLAHFATAFFDLYLKEDQSKREYLDLIPRAEDGLFDMEEGQPGELHTYWKGFVRYTGRGLVLEHKEAGE